MKIDFLIIGAQKCGTSTLFSLLNQHPDLEGCSNKEPRFWSHTRNWEKGVSYYHGLFKEKPGVKYFEASTAYTFYPLRRLNIWDDIHQYNPDTKLIYIVRNPVDRIRSAYMHSYEVGWEDLPINEAIIKNRMYIDVSRYYTQVKPWIRRFGRENVLLLDFDDLIRHPESMLLEAAKFLGVNPDGFSDVIINHKNKSVGEQKVKKEFIKYTGYAGYYKNKSPDFLKQLIRPLWRYLAYNQQRKFHIKPELCRTYRKMIIEILSDDIDQFSRISGKELSKWKSIDSK